LFPIALGNLSHACLRGVNLADSLQERLTLMRVLIIDDEENIRKTTSALLEDMGHEVVAVSNGAGALKQLENTRFDVAFLDLKLEDEDGLDLVPALLKSAEQLDIVVFTAFASFETAVEAMRRGAVDYLPKPFRPEQVRQALTRIARTQKLQGRVAELESRVSNAVPEARLTTTEPVMQKLLDVAFTAAAAPATILVLGESGTGKSVLARAIHERSPQRERAFVTVNCPSLSRELLESELFGHKKGAFTGAVGETWGKVTRAEGGTLFLDEIGELPPEIQPKLLRLLQEKEYERVGEAMSRRANVRVVAATNRKLEDAVREGRFREDLFYRINVIALQMPPLRERRGDLLGIARDYLQFCAAQCNKRVKGFSSAAEQVILQYAWPGNLRELRNVVERAVILAEGEVIEPPDFPEKLSAAAPAVQTGGTRLGGNFSLEELENEHIRQVLRTAPSLETAAQILGIDNATLYRKRKKLGL
jgi:NtrC-family two-component system response regulator AlgB